MSPRRWVRWAVWSSASIISFSFGMLFVGRGAGDPGSILPTSLVPGSSHTPLEREPSGQISHGLNPFRADRRPTAVRFGTITDTPPPEPVEARSLDLRLSGLAGGPPWRALIEGVPGHEGGLLVSVGDEIEGVTVLHVSRDSVVVSVQQFIQTLTPKRPWQ